MGRSRYKIYEITHPHFLPVRYSIGFRYLSMHSISGICNKGKLFRYHYHLTPKLSSMLGPHKTNRYPTKVLLHKGERQSRYFLNKAMCTAANKCRDEYPYNTTFEGGSHNYTMGRASVDYVSRSESGRQGRFIDTFYSGANIQVKDAFFVFPFAPISGYLDEKWIWHSFGQ